MKYCFNCNRITVGEPLFCDSCGASYDVKFCPRMHPNRRSAEVCSQCGSRDLSIPQPRVPLWGRILIRLVPILAGLVLAFVTLSFLVGLLQSLRDRPDTAFLLAVTIGFLWWSWTQIPQSIRQFLYRLIKRREGHEKR